MRFIRKVTAEEEGFRLEQCESSPCVHPRRNSVEPEPVGTVVLLPFRIAGYDKDCDGSLMARLENLDLKGRETGWNQKHIGLQGNGFVVTQEELKALGAHQSAHCHGLTCEGPASIPCECNCDGCKNARSSSDSRIH